MPDGSSQEITGLPQAEPKPKSDLLSKLEGPNSGVVEKIGQSEVDALVQKIGDFYNIPEPARAKARQSTILVLKNEDLIKLETDRIKKKVEKKMGPDQGLSDTQKESIKEAANDEAGVTIPLDENKSVILIKEKSKFQREMIVVHELIHSMVQRGVGDESGFYFVGEGKNLNEAAVQVLTLGLLDPDIDPEVLFDRIKNGEVVTIYPAEVQRLLNVLIATTLGEKPMTIQDLGKIYFTGKPESGILFKIGVLRKIPQQYDDVRQKVNGLFESDLGSKPKTNQ